MNEPRYDLDQGGAADVDQVTTIWHAGWRDGHLGHVPDELLAHRTLASFAERTAAMIDRVRVARDASGAVAGFVYVVDDEVEQVYVSAEHRGTGVAELLLTAAEAAVADAGHAQAWLAVVAGNARARRFYERRGWVDAGAISYQAAGREGPVEVPCHRYEKALAR